jgi:SAM-dependent methyltransferase
LPSDPRHVETYGSAEIEILRPRRIRNGIYHLVGLAFMTLNVVRHKIQGYRTPRPRMTANANEAFVYDRAVVNNWLEHLERHVGHDQAPQGLDVLELGPGPDLGTGMILLSRGARSYLAIDAHRLVTRTPAQRHRELAALIEQEEDLEHATIAPREALEAFLDGTGAALSYRHLPGFDLSTLADDSVDLVVSHSVFEHVDDVPATIRELARITRGGGHFVAEIDLQTHTRWIRDADPLNIYRYQRHVYRALSFSGSPNRVRPDEYLDAFESTGWGNPRIYPRRVLDPSYVDGVEPSLCPVFRGDPEQLGWLSIVLCATRRPAVRKRRATPT